MLPVCWPASSLLPALGRPRLFWNRIQLLPPSRGGGRPSLAAFNVSLQTVGPQEGENKGSSGAQSRPAKAGSRLPQGVSSP